MRNLRRETKTKGEGSIGEERKEESRINIKETGRSPERTRTWERE
jgi:hypothetical protein